MSTMIVGPVRPAPTVRLVSVFAALALLPMITAHVIGAPVVDPLTDPISWYAFVPGGSLMIITGGALLSLLGVLLTIRMYRCRLVTGLLPGVAMAVFCLALILVGLCPTDPPHSPVSLPATIHRVAAGAAFAVLPLVGLRVAACRPDPVSRLPSLLRRSAVLLGVLVGSFLSIHLPLAFLGSGIAAFGLLERAGFVIMIGYLFLLGATIDREGAGTVTEGAGDQPVICWSASSAVNGLAMSSSAACSAFTPKINSATPPRAITPAETRKPTATGPRWPESIKAPNSYGPTMPPSPVPTA